VWVIVADARNIVVDTGFDSGQAAGRGRTLIRPVAEGLAAIGVDPSDVADVVITHMHYDHAGNTALFPQARFHVQDAEMGYCTGRAMTHPHLSAFFEAENVVAMVRRVFDGRVVFHAGDSVLCPGVTLHHLPGHTPGLQAVRVETARGPVVLASDAAHFWANLQRETPYPVVADVTQYLESLRALRMLAPSIDHIIPGHDPAVLARFPAAAGPDIVRLDLAPVPRAAS
jgi:glyoxylase-like metal-dependent hydrolase (beta-lactamase superfamily II)